MSVLDPPEIVLAGPILPSATELFSTQLKVSTEPHIDHSTKQDDVDEEEEENRSERKSESELDSYVGDDPLESAHLITRATCIPPDEVDTLVVMQWSIEQLWEQRAQGTSRASSSSAPPMHAPLLRSIGYVIPLDTSTELALASEIEPTGQTTGPADRVDGDTTQTDT
ncbi:hypothetical protein K7X08_022999 [Anisodus acutangulus]|uniref:Uncharacterized protein n=1 Tax=Anisodus acutangulus TaxID=402998 RepID=A0A9Q1MBN2_9SOLA|nr:hypothetical protein K7X08_022999 [Anisodus acutangulus]